MFLLSLLHRCYTAHSVSSVQVANLKTTRTNIPRSERRTLPITLLACLLADQFVITSLVVITLEQEQASAIINISCG